MGPKGWDGSHNFIKASMEYSFDNAEGIVDYYIIKLQQHEMDDPGLLNLLNLVSPKGQQFLTLCGKYQGDISAKLAQSSDKNVLVGDMQEKMTEGKNIVI